MAKSVVPACVALGEIKQGEREERVVIMPPFGPCLQFMKHTEEIKVTQPPLKMHYVRS